MNGNATKSIQKFQEIIKSSGKIFAIDEEELHLKNPKAVEISLRRRAIQGRRTSWIFLAIIMLLVGTAGLFVQSLLGTINSVEKALLDDYSHQLKERLQEAEDTKQELDATLSDQKHEVIEYLTGLGVQWEDVTPETIKSVNRLDNFILTPTGDVLALVSSKQKHTVWKSEDRGNSWQPGDDIENLGSFPSLFINEDRLFLFGQYGGGLV